MNSLSPVICWRCHLSSKWFLVQSSCAAMSTFAGDKAPSPSASSSPSSSSEQSSKRRNSGDAFSIFKRDSKFMLMPEAIKTALMAAGRSQSSDSKQTRKPEPGTKPKKSENKRRKLSGNPDERHTANVFITPGRAYVDYLLTTTDLSGLWNTKRRSPFAGRSDIIVYLRVDVEKRAVDIWGSLSKLEQEKERRRKDMERNPEEANAILTAMRSYSALIDSHTAASKTERREIYEGVNRQQGAPNFEVDSVREFNKQDKDQRKRMSGSGRVVWMAIGVNSANAVMKLMAYLHTGSSAMFSETVHSLADTVNQAILAFGLWQSKRVPDQLHPYGWYNFSYVSSLISGVGIFFVGAGLSWFHGIQSLLHPEPLESTAWALTILAVSFLTESATLAAGIRQIQREAAKAKLSFFEFVRRGYDPSVNVVLGEDFVAVVGVGVAASCLSLSYFCNWHTADAVGSLVIGTLLAGVASHIVYTNAVTLVGQSIPAKRRDLMRQQLESDRIIRACHDIKATEMGGRRVRFKAEVDIDGRELTRIYLDRIDVDILLFELQKASKSVEDLEAFMLRHGEAIVDLIGAEIDRVERQLKAKHPEVRHVDLEVL